ncbi:FadR/GntR family transcriptional regulator [Conexibacter woesei]|uniref:GntR domain protein n=1 Tax=Conexibacter woesei (strain DSM 14684 / CCUG 47730 / CIP 108061 / JCM 11494 / NBRC 100937 / ID131577) TaxID=469383 RepID=D3FB08_CONWI|nr:FadR/GntR family transcriptional regulator [Conexibacter woesei]ADB53200.1 GntR domain protein [Conexibacter woesei DSM 14684]
MTLVRELANNRGVSLGAGTPRPSGSDLLTEQVVELIDRERLEPGDRLPTVQALADRFSVAAPTMREVLRRLQAVGVVELRHGSGVYVRHGGRRVVLPNPYPGRLEPDTILDLLDARLLIEPHLAHLAARAGADEIGELAQLIARARELLGGGGDAELSRTNLDFHRGVARCAGNLVLAQVIDSLLDLYSAEQMEVMRLYADRVHDHEEHVEILEAIQAHDPELASERMQRHLEDVKSVVAARIDAGEVK